MYKKLFYNCIFIKYTFNVLTYRGCKMSHITRKHLRLLILTILGICCIIALRYPGQNPTLYLIAGPFRIPNSTKSGILSGTLSLITFLLVFTDYKNGLKIGLTLIVISTANLISGMVRNNTITAMPGLVTNMVSVITLVTIYSFYKRLSISNLTDYITGFGNRRHYVKVINEHIEARKSFTIACIDVEDFKHVNDLYGIQPGDFLLKHTAEKLSSILNKHDMLFRISGSNFAILFEPGESPEERLKKVINTETVLIPHSFNGDEATETEIRYVVSLAAGVVYSHPPYNSKKTASAVLHNAETALAATRNLTSHKICIYNESMENVEAKQRDAEFLVKEALKNNWFYLVYQPQFTTNEKKLRGFETLIRCRKPDCSIVSPVTFIPAAEKSNLIMQIDDWVLKNAMKEFKTVIENSDKDLKLSINVSAKNMGSADFAMRVKNIIDNTRFPPESLEIEITEYSFAESLETTIANIKTLHSIGVQIALDDFGTGYTSIKQLMKLPINLLKIDKTLIDDIEKDQTMQDMIDSVIYMGHIMNCEVICEGVEEEAQVDFLSIHKCDYIQGFVWSKPLSYEDARILCE